MININLTDIDQKFEFEIKIKVLAKDNSLYLMHLTSNDVIDFDINTTDKISMITLSEIIESFFIKKKYINAYIYIDKITEGTILKIIEIMKIKNNCDMFYKFDSYVGIKIEIDE